jgi:hypothetical protein
MKELNRREFFGLSAAGLVLTGCRPTLHADILISDVSVIDVATGQVIDGQDVLIEGEVIRQVFSHGDRRVQADSIIVGEGRYVMPGLWDMHVHVRSYDPEDILPMFVAYGVTGIRDLGLTSLSSIKQAQAQISEGSMVGPRIISSGVIVEGAEPRFRSSLSVSSREDIARQLDPVVEQGVGVIKLFQNVPGEVFQDVVAYAEEKGLKTAGHIPDEWDQIQAANSGLGSIEYMWGIKNTLAYEDDRLDPVEVSRLADALLAQNTFQTPTLINFSSKLDRESEEFTNRPGVEYSPAYHRVWWDVIRAAGLEPEVEESMRAARPFETAVVRELARLGVKFLAGTDTPNPYLPVGLSLHEELALLVEAGLSPAEALRTATLYPAEYFGRTADLGAVARGYLADLVVLDRNPLEDVRNTTAVYAVVSNGRFFSPAALAEIRSEQLRRAVNFLPTDLDQVVYMEIRRNGVDGARLRFPDPLNDSSIVAKAEHLIRLSESLVRVGERDEARRVLEWNLELFPEDENTRIRLAALPDGN